MRLALPPSHNGDTHVAIGNGGHEHVLKARLVARLGQRGGRQAVCRDRNELTFLGRDMTDPSAQKSDALRPDARRDRDLPWVVEKLGWRYHHIGVPTEIPRSGERYL